ncbi:hypothetical protein [Streptomyces meridianus]|uniref:Lipoprotein n=1 Tax=Streptomyces meridianus TaxID=2938945 RepID=A0ABT0X0U5_9ACTN|nr:hypothetical protein [Streptomyces meridianus]MCM2576189.1 hypothetical protein [Streptomyces meridianus]
MTARNAVVVGAVCAGLALALAGCGSEEHPDAGTNGVAKLSASKIERKARDAAGKAVAVRLSGTVVVSKGRTYKLNMRLREDGGFGHLVTKGSTFRLLRIDEDLYLKADADFWAGQKGQQAEGTSVARKLDDKYVKVPEGDPAYKQLSGFTDMKVLMDGLLGLHGKLAKGDRGQVGGTRTVRITGDDGAGGSLDVSLEGTPYPLRLQRAGGAGTLRLTAWNKTFDLQAPDEDQVVDYGRQITAG